VALIRTQADLAEARRQAVDSHVAVAQALGLPLQAIEGRELKLDLVGEGWFVDRDLKPQEKVVVVGAQELLSEELKGQGTEE